MKNLNEKAVAKRKQKYQLRTSLFHQLACGIIFTLIVVNIGVIIAFYAMVTHLVEQSIAMGFIKNIKILSVSLAELIQNEWEIFGNDLTLVSRILQDILANPGTVDTDFEDNYEEFIYSTVDVAFCVGKPCEYQGHVYQFLQTGGQVT